MCDANAGFGIMGAAGYRKLPESRKLAGRVVEDDRAEQEFPVAARGGSGGKS